MKKLLFTLIACVLCLGMVGGAFAYFQDTETSTGNIFSGGVLDLMLSNGGPWVNTPPALTIASAANMEPGVEVGPFDVWFLNNGTMDGKVRVGFSYTESDVVGSGEFYPGVNVNEHDYARALIVTEAFLDGGSTNVAPYWAQQIIDAGFGLAAGAVVSDGSSATGYLPTVYGLSKITLYFSDTYMSPEWVWSPAEQHYEIFTLKLSEAATSDYAFDGVNVTLTATIVQMDAP